MASPCGTKLTSRQTDGSVNFNHAYFGDGMVDFSSGHFFGPGIATFIAAHFSGGVVSFIGAHFSGSTVYFRNADFSGTMVGGRSDRQSKLSRLREHADYERAANYNPSAVGDPLDRGELGWWPPRYHSTSILIDKAGQPEGQDSGVIVTRRLRCAWTAVGEGEAAWIRLPRRSSAG